jgi:hypothetical protein
MAPANGLVGNNERVADLSTDRDHRRGKLESLAGHRAGLGKKLRIHVRAERTGRILTPCAASNPEDVPLPSGSVSAGCSEERAQASREIALIAPSSLR